MNFAKSSPLPGGWIPPEKRRAMERAANRADRDEREKNQRKLTAEAINGHPLAHVVGGTKVTNYRTARSGVRWATRRKRRG